MNALVFKILKPSATFRGVEYNGRKVEKGQAVLLHRSGFGPVGIIGRSPSWRQLQGHLVTHSSSNRRIRQPQFHAILSCRNHSHTPEQLGRIGLSLMDRLGYGGNPMLLYTHHDTRHNHIHIVTSRVGRDGRKVPDRFEAIRSQRILMELLGRDAGDHFKKAVEKALSYRFSTVAQFMLLMESQGYKGLRRGDGVSFIRHGTVQGAVPLSVLDSRSAAPRIGASDRGRVRALILRHADQHDRTLQAQTAGKYGGDMRWQSALTRHLHGRYGLEFVFFTGKGHAKPYGYAIIDHANKVVFKGGDVMGMPELTGTKSKTTISTSIPQLVFPVTENLQMDQNKRDENKNTLSLLMLAASLANDIENGAADDMRREEISSRRKKRCKRK
jgi:hypothetical protein